MDARTVAGKYVLLRRLATGGMGEIWLARNETTGAELALKMLRRRGGDADADALAHAEARFRHEARISAKLVHRNIVRVFDLVEESDGTLALVMELLRGESLSRWLGRNGPRSTKEAVALLSPILAALEHAHRSGVVHRDVTPGNVLLAVEPDGVVPKLVDFGIAKPSTGSPVQTLEGSVLGTPRYMSPEQIRGAALDGRADVFSAAVVVYETIAGVSPFAGATASAELAAVLEGVVDPDPRIEPPVWIELRRALSKQPYERHASAADFAAALRTAVGETETGLADVRASAPPPEVGAGEVGAGGVTRTLDGRSVEVVLPRSGGGPMRWVAVAAVLIAAVGVGLVASGGWRGRTVAAAPGTASTSAASTAPIIASAADTAKAAPPVMPSSFVPSEGATPVMATVKRPVRSPSRPAITPVAKPVATTPGF